MAHGAAAEILTAKRTDGIALRRLDAVASHMHITPTPPSREPVRIPFKLNRAARRPL
jgi:hypothetical protein